MSLARAVGEAAMGSGEGLVEIRPRELQFRFEVKKQSSCSVHLVNRTDEYVAFKVKTTSPKRYCVRPNIGVIFQGQLRFLQVEDVQNMESELTYLEEKLKEAENLIIKLREEAGTTIQERDKLRHEMGRSHLRS